MTTMTYCKFGQGSSNRAYLAESEGRYPMSRINRSLCDDYDIPSSWPVCVIKNCLERYHGGEWHHTSRVGNETAFYDLAELAEMISEGELVLSEARGQYEQAREARPKAKRERYRVIAARVDWFGTGRYKNNQVVSGLGWRDGPWIIFDEDGTRKKVGSNWVRFERKDKPGRPSKVDLAKLERWVSP